jgi:SAM-dependent methyltransferase
MPSEKMKLLEAGSPEYKQAFELCLGLGSGGATLEERLEAWTRPLPRRVAVDWGAGGGRASALLCQRFERVYAVEPSPAMRASIAGAAPEAIVVAGDLQSAVIPEAVDFGLINHVLYHLPEADWGRLVLDCAARLSAGGALCISQKHPAAGCGDLMEHFGARRFDLYRLLDAFRGQETFSIEFASTPGRLSMRSFEDTLTVARFVLSDRTAREFSRLGSEREFRDFVREHFWNEELQQGGWDNPKVYATIRRNPLDVASAPTG